MATLVPKIQSTNCVRKESTSSRCFEEEKEDIGMARSRNAYVMHFAP